MPYYKECNLLFIHIPKTGGTCIDTQICKSRKRTLYTIFRNDLLPEPYKNISLQHQFYTCLLYTSPSPREQRGSAMAGCGL